MGDHFGTFLPISVSIGGTSPKPSWWIALVKLYKPTSFWIKTHRGAGSVGKKVFKIRNPDEISAKLLWQIVLVILYKPTRFGVQAHQGAWLVSKRNPKTPKLRIRILAPAGAAGAAFAIFRMSHGSRVRDFRNRERSSCWKSRMQLLLEISNAAPV